MQDVEKTEIRREPNAKRRRCRNRKRPLYSLFVAALVAGVGVSLSMTVFFNIQTIEITGESPQYTIEQISEASGVHTGDNMMRLNRDDVEQNILSRMPFVERIEVKKEFPDVLVIEVTPSRCAFNVTDDSGTLQVSASGKILINGPEADETLPVIIGFEASEREPGKKLVSADEQKKEIFDTLSALITKGLDVPITEIDMTDKYDLRIEFDDRIWFSLGNWSELEYKVQLAETALAELAEDKVGYLTMIGDHQCSYRDKDAVERQTTAPFVTTATDENGMVITQTDENGNYITTETQTMAVTQ